MCAREPGQKWHKKQCIKRQCESCGTDGIVAFYTPLIAKASDRITYTKWERVMKVRKGKETTQVMPKSHEKGANLVVIELANELEKLAEHMFVANWQQVQFSGLVKTVPPNWVVLNMDFSENYSCSNQNEVQSAHWGHNSVTIHPTVAYYQCPREECFDIVQEALVFVSDDLQHDAHAVAKFTSLANEHLQNVRGLTIEREIQLTDGCSAQYKSKTPFTDISFADHDHGFPVERHFYGSRHGKGPSDGVGAVVKSSAKRSVMGMNCVINNAEDLFNFGKEMLEKTEIKNDHLHHKRTFFLVNNISRDRPERSKTKTLSGTRKVQSIKSRARPFTLFTRNLSCFCCSCTSHHDDADGLECENKLHVQDWERKDLVKEQIGERGHVRGRGRARSRGEQVAERGQTRGRGQARGRGQVTVRGQARGRGRTRVRGQVAERGQARGRGATERGVVRTRGGRISIGQGGRGVRSRGGQYSSDEDSEISNQTDSSMLDAHLDVVNDSSSDIGEEGYTFNLMEISGLSDILRDLDKVPDGSDGTLLEDNTMDLEDIAYSPVIPNLEDQHITEDQLVYQSVTRDQPIDQSVTEHQPILGDQPVDRSVTADQPVDQSVIGDLPIDQSVTRDQPIDQSVTEDQPILGDQPVDKSITEDQPVLGEQPIDLSVTENQPVLGDQPIDQSVTADQPIDQPVSAHQPVDQSVTAHQPVDQSVTGEQPVDQSVTGDQPVDQSVTGEQPLDQSVTGEQPVNQAVTAHQPVDKSVTGEQPVNQSVTADQPVDQSVTADQSMIEDQSVCEKSYNQGQFLKIAHGSRMLPAVVHEWPFVRFFSMVHSGWQDGDILHTVIADDVVGAVEPPDIVMHGSRIFYKFNDF